MRIQSESIEQEGPERLLSGYDGLLVGETLVRSADPAQAVKELMP